MHTLSHMLHLKAKFNSFVPNAPFLHPLKTSENLIETSTLICKVSQWTGFYTTMLIALLKKRFWHRSFPLNFVKFLRTRFFVEHLRWLRLIFLKRSLDLCSKFDKLMIIEYLNAELNMENAWNFLWKLSNLMKVRASYKNPERFLCIDLPLTNEPKSFQSSSAVETGLSDFHKMAVTLMKTTLERSQNWSQRSLILGSEVSLPIKNLRHNC